MDKLDVIHSIQLNKYHIKCLNNLIILSIYKKQVDNLYMKYIVNNFIMNDDVRLENVPNSGKSKADIIWVQVTMMFYRFIIRFTIGLGFLFIAFLLQFFMAHMFSLSISSSTIYYSTLSSHIYLSVDIISVYVNVGMYQWSVLSPLLFAVVMDVVHSEARGGIPSEFLYA